MRFRLPLGRSLFFVCAFLFALVALLPLRLAVDWLSLDDRAFAAREAKGSIWFGGLSEVQLGPVALGDLQAGLRTLPLLIGRARVDLKRRGDEDPFEGSATVSRHGFGFDDVTARVALGSAFAPLPLGSFDLSQVTVRYADGLCASAQGAVTANLAADVAGLTLQSGLTGTARCEDGALLLPLKSQSGMEGLSIRLYDDGRYRVELAVNSTDPLLGAKLAASGFTQTNAGYVLGVDGTF